MKMIKGLLRLFKRKRATTSDKGWSMEDIHKWGEELRKKQQEEMVFWR